MKATLSTESYPVESDRQPKIVEINRKSSISAKVKNLQKKVKDHNAKNPKYRATYRMLAAVFRRGVGL